MENVEFRIMPNGKEGRWYWEVIKDAREVVARGVTDTAAQKRSWLAAREFAKRSPRNIIRPYLRIPETPPFSLSGGILVLANDTRSSPRPCEKFRTKHN